MRLFFGLLGILAAFPVAAEDAWILQSGPEAWDSIPLDPVQPVPSWRGAYGDGEQQVWVYATASPHFFAPELAQVRRITGTRWTAVIFVPASWTALQRSAWFDLWSREFRSLQSLPSPGWPITFPSVLRKG